MQNLENHLPQWSMITMIDFDVWSMTKIYGLWLLVIWLHTMIYDLLVTKILYDPLWSTPYIFYLYATQYPFPNQQHQHCPSSS